VHGSSLPSQGNAGRAPTHSIGAARAHLEHPVLSRRAGRSVPDELVIASSMAGARIGGEIRSPGAGLRDRDVAVVSELALRHFDHGLRVFLPHIASARSAKSESNVADHPGLLARACDIMLGCGTTSTSTAPIGTSELLRMRLRPTTQSSASSRIRRSSLRSSASIVLGWAISPASRAFIFSATSGLTRFHWAGSTSHRNKLGELL